jgi:hypothetical protein
MNSEQETPQAYAPNLSPSASYATSGG